MHPADPAPIVFTQTPSLEALIATLNRRADQVTSLESSNATLKADGIPALSANIAWQRDRNFRLRAGTLIGGGTELDMGSNDELFWLWSRRNHPPATYFCRHSQFAGSAAEQFLPVEPAWLSEAMGVVRFNPQDEHILGNSNATKVQIVSRITGSQGVVNRVVQVDYQYARVENVAMYDMQGQLLAMARLNKHLYYEQADMELPTWIDIELPPAELKFTLNVGGYNINQLVASPAMWQMPQISGYPLVDLADPYFQNQLRQSPRNAIAPTYTPMAESNYSEYRGYRR